MNLYLRLLIITLILWPAATLAAPMQQATCQSVMDVATTAEFNQAISCYNSQSAASTYTINLTADLTLDGGTTTVNNTRNNMTLQLKGNDYVMDGSNAYRVLRIALGTTVTIDHLTVRAGKATTGGGIYNQGTLTIHQGTFSQNSTTGFGGALYNTGALTVNGSTFSLNIGGFGGALYNQGGTVTLNSSELTDNSASSTGGAIATGSSGTLLVTDSTFRRNSAVNKGGAIATASGSNITVRSTLFQDNTSNVYGGAIHNTTAIDLSNSTFSGNSAQFGGAIRNEGTANIYNNTLSANRATNSGAGFHDVGTLHLFNTIIANSTGGGDCVNVTGSAIASQSHNLIEEGNAACGITDGSNGSIVGQDPNLGPLQNNGGPTWTFLPMGTSPAIDSGDDDICTLASVNKLDQRGESRPSGSTCDIGAVEAVAPVNINAKLSQIGRGTLQCTPGADAAYPTQTTIGHCNVTFTLQNRSAQPLQISHYEVTVLTGHNWVLNGVNGPAQIGAKVSDVRDVAVSTTFNPYFHVGFTAPAGWRIRFNVFGSVGTTGFRTNVTAPVELLGQFELSAAQFDTLQAVGETIYLPIVIHE